MLLHEIRHAVSGWQDTWPSIAHTQMSMPMMGTWVSSGSWLAVVTTSSFLVDLLKP